MIPIAVVIGDLEVGGIFNEITYYIDGKIYDSYNYMNHINEDTTFVLVHTEDKIIYIYYKNELNNIVIWYEGWFKEDVGNNELTDLLNRGIDDVFYSEYTQGHTYTCDDYNPVIIQKVKKSIDIYIRALHQIEYIWGNSLSVKSARNH
jgi:hypothetical protein